MDDRTIVCERYAASTFSSWTDGPKYVFDTHNLSGIIELDHVVSVFTIKSDAALTIELEHVIPLAVGTFYFINDERMAGIAKRMRPDLDIRLLLV